MESPFSAIQQSKVSEDIVKQVKSLIRNGQLQPGEKLPSERQLAQMLEVGRSSLREAINTLAMMGLVEIKQRKGIYVRSVGAGLVSDPLRQMMKNDKKAIINLYDLRIDLEVASARLAAKSRTAEQLDLLRQHLNAAQAENGEYPYKAQNDLDFHSTIAAATDNFLRVHIINEIFTIAGQHLKTALDQFVAQPGSSDMIHKQHEAIFDAIAGQRASKAADAMHTHLKWVKKQFEAYL